MAGTCSNPQCDVDETSKCLEGFSDLTDCSSYSGELVEAEPSSEEIAETEVVDITEKKIGLMGQQSLDTNNADQLLKKNGGKFIACVGPANVGKTTLFASLYDLLQDGPIDEWSFGGSSTIFSFEQLCHSARFTSNRDCPETPRTPASDGLSYYHLALCSSLEDRIDLFLADRAGELYCIAADSSEACEQLEEVIRADIILFLIDSESLGDSGKRHITKRQTLSIIEAFSESNMIGQGAKVVITLTRFDRALRKGTNESATDQHLRLLESAKKILGAGIEVVGEVVAARPDSSEWAQPGYGLIPLLQKIVEHDAPKTPVKKRNTSRVSRTFLNPEFGL